MTVLHATEPATPYLSLFARIDSFTREEVDDALFESKSSAARPAGPRSVGTIRELRAEAKRLEDGSTGRRSRRCTSPR
jgi:hypothetical protein